MPQLSNSVSVPISCPLYLDIGKGMQTEQTTNVKPHFEAGGGGSSEHSSQGLLEVGYLYENLLKTQPNLYPSLFAESFNYCLGQSYRTGNKGASPKSFSIESILGFPGNTSPSSEMLCNSYFTNLPSYCGSNNKNGHFVEKQFALEPTTTINYRTTTNGALSAHCIKDATVNQNARFLVSNEREHKLEKANGNCKSYAIPNRKSNKTSKPNGKNSHNGPNATQFKSKRVRTIFTSEQLERLETEFERQQYMVGSGRHYLASTLNLTEAQVKVWFQNRRIKWRKQHLETQQDKGTNKVLQADFVNLA